MALPAAIQAQVDRADALLAEANAVPTAPPTPDPVDPSQTAPAVVAPPVEQQAQAPTQQPQADVVWERKFKSLQGTFNKEVPALRAQVKDLTARLEQTAAQIEASKAKPEPIAQKPVADPKDVENFGEDLVDMVHRTTESVFSRVAQRVDTEFAKIVERILALEQQVAGTVQTVAVSAEDRFFELLARSVPDWETTNTSQDFLDWLEEIDPVYGLARKAALTHARQNLDAQRAISIFTAFAGVKPSQPPVQANRVDRQVSPRASAASAPPTLTAKPVIAQAEFVRFYDDVRRGKYRGAEAEAARIEAELNAAMAEGRVR